ncbi:MAG: DUF2958 domain-containing protein [Chloroflexota bacterium]
MEELEQEGFLTELDPETQVAFGYCYDASYPDGAELGYIDLEELRAVRGPYGLGVERDIWWRPKPLSESKP